MDNLLFRKENLVKKDQKREEAPQEEETDFEEIVDKVIQT